MSGDVFGSVLSGVNSVGSLFTGIFNAASQRKFNKQMLQLYRDQLAEQQRQFDVSIQNQWDMWNATNEYNSPENQRQLMEDAGYSPYALVGGNGSYSGSSEADVMSMPTMDVPAPPSNMAPVQLSSDIISEPLRAIAEWRSIQGDTEIKNWQSKIESVNYKYREAELISSIYERMSNATNAKEKAYYQRILNNFAQEQQQSEVANKWQDLENKRVMMRGMLIDNAMKFEELKVLPQQLQADLASTYADVVLKLARKELTVQQAENLFYERLNIHADTQLKEAQTREAMTAADKNVSEAQQAESVVNLNDARTEQQQEETKVYRRMSRSLVQKAYNEAQKSEYNIGSDNLWQFMQHGLKINNNTTFEGHYRGF